MGPGDINTLNQRKQALDNAKAQLAAITGRTQTTTDCIGVLVEAGKNSNSGGTYIPHVPLSVDVVTRCQWCELPVTKWKNGVSCTAPQSREYFEQENSKQAHPLLVALCKVQLAQLRMAEAEGLSAIANLTNFIKANESPLFGATLIPPVNKTPGRH